MKSGRYSERLPPRWLSLALMHRTRSPILIRIVEALVAANGGPLPAEALAALTYPEGTRPARPAARVSNTISKHRVHVEALGWSIRSLHGAKHGAGYFLLPLRVRP